MQMKLEPDEVREAVHKHATSILTPLGWEVGDITLHTGGGATVTVSANPDTLDEAEVARPPTVEEAKESARTRAKPADSGDTDEKKGKK